MVPCGRCNETGVDPARARLQDDSLGCDLEPCTQCSGRGEVDVVDNRQKELDDLLERTRRMTQAAVEASQANVTILDRLKHSEVVVKAACALIDDPSRINNMWALEEAVIAYRKGMPS